MIRRLVVALALVGAAVAPAMAQPGLPSPRKMSGVWRPDHDVAAGTAQVRLTHDDLADPRPPAGVVVALVGYAASGRVTVARVKTDARGVATFTGLETSGAVAYYALATLTRNRVADRLVASPWVPGGTHGARLILSSERRTVAAAPFDERLPGTAGQPPAPPRGKVWVKLEGAAWPGMAVELFDAATGKVVAKGTATDKELMLATAPRAGQVLYAEGIRGTGRYRSAPFVGVADRGAAVSILVYPGLVPTFRFFATADDVQLRVGGEYRFLNYTWIPYGDVLPLAVPLPRGARRASADSDEVPVAVSGDTITVTRAIPPGGATVHLGFELPAVGGDIAWKLDLPHGSFQSSLYIDREGVTLEPPPDHAVSTVTHDGITYFAFADITSQPKQPFELTIHPPKLTRAEAALAQACRPLAPDRHATLRGQVAPSFSLAQPDGKLLKLASLRGKPVLLSFMATWDQLSPEERPRLVKLARQVPPLQIVMVASDDDPAKVSATVGTTSPFRVVLDPAPPGANIGRVTTSWGVKLLPESFLLDRNGVVRFYFANARDWSTPEALACVKAVAALR